MPINSIPSYYMTDKSTYDSSYNPIKKYDPNTSRKAD